MKASHLGACAAGAAVVALVVWMLVPPSEQPFHDYVAKLKAAGEPTTFAEAHGPMPPEEENAAPEIDAAAQWLHATHGDSSSWTVVGPWNQSSAIPLEETITPEQRAALQEFLAAIEEPFFRRVSNALDRPRLKFPLALDARGIRDSKHLSLTLEVLRVLGAKARFAARPDDRLNACTDMVRLGVQSEHVDLLGDMVAMAAAREGLRALRDAMARGDADADADAVRWRGRIGPALARPWLAGMGEVWSNEATFWMCLYDGVVQGRVSWTAFASGARTLPGPMTVAKGRAASLLDRILGRPVEFELRPGMARWVTDTCEAFREVRRLGTSSYPKFASEVSAPEAVASHGNPWESLTADFRHVARLCALTEAATRLARIALAAAEHRATRGDWPASLDDLRWAFPEGVPLDPFTDAPFEFAHTATGVRIASLGRLRDEPAVSDEELRDRNLVWTLGR